MFKKINSILIITIGCLIAGFGTSCFLLPNKLSSGGFSGISTILYYFYKYEYNYSYYEYTINCYRLLQTWKRVCI